MQQASKQFSDEQRNRIEQAVIAAERRTSAEIIPVVATASGRYDRPEDIVGLWLGAIGLILAWWLLPTSHAESGDWGIMPPGLRLGIMVAAVAIGFVVGATIGSRVAWLRRLFTPSRQMTDEVRERARAAFFDSRVHQTARNTGVLIYVSLYERMAAVLADQAVMKKLGQPAIDGLCSVLTEKLRHAHPTDAICDVIGVAGEKLGAVLPHADDDIDELPNRLIVLDG